MIIATPRAWLLLLVLVWQPAATVLCCPCGSSSWWLRGLPYCVSRSSPVRQPCATMEAIVLVFLFAATIIIERCRQCFSPTKGSTGMEKASSQASGSMGFHEFKDGGPISVAGSRSSCFREVSVALLCCSVSA